MTYLYILVGSTNFLIPFKRRLTPESESRARTLKIETPRRVQNTSLLYCWARPKTRQTNMRESRVCGRAGPLSSRCVQVSRVDIKRTKAVSLSRHTTGRYSRT